MITDLQEKYLTDGKGKRIAVMLDIQIYEKMLEDLDELYYARGYEQAVKETDPEIAARNYIII